MTGLAFKPAYVFDLSQTEGKPIPDPFTELQGDIDSAKKEAIFKALEKVTGIPIEFQDIKGGAKGYYSPMQNKIVIKTGMSDLQTLKTAFHETAHSLLHDPDKKIVTVKAPRNEKEVHAESVAFMVAERFGMDTSDYSFPYIASWSEGKQKDQLMRALDEIQDAAKAITSAVEWELLKMRKRDLSIEDKLADTELNNVQKAELLIEDYADKGFNFTKEDTDRLLETAADNEDIYQTVDLANDIVMIQQQRDRYGYDFTGMIPFENKEAALAAFDRGDAVYLLYPDNTEGMAIERSEIENFDGYFGVEKEEKEEKSIATDEHLVLVSKEVALEMWDKDLDVFIDGVPAFSRDDIVNAPDEAQIHLAEYQYTAELDFDKPARRYGKEKKVAEHNVNNQPKSVKNPNIIGNTPYAELGDKSSLMYYPNLKNRHADNIAKQLDADGIRFSGVRKGEITTITINKADIKRYEAAVEKVKASYRRTDKPKEPVSEESRETAVKPEQTARASRAAAPAPVNPNIIGNTPYTELGNRMELKYFTGLNSRHADNIAKQLNAEGIRFSGLRKGTVTTITINKADIPRYEAVVEKVKASYRAAPIVRQSEFVADMPQKPKAPKPVIPEQRPDLPTSLADIPICKQSFLEAKQSGNEQGWQNSVAASKACIKYLNDHLYDAYEARNLKGLVKDMEEKFGLDRTMYTISATIQLKDRDGRFSREAKDRAREYTFDSDRARLAFLTEAHPVMLCSFYECLIDREKELSQPQIESEKDKDKLPSHLADKFLFSSERVELREDYRGIPETHFYNSSVNEYHVEGYGWLSDTEYDNKQKESGLSVKEFAAKIDMVNANYVSVDGRTGQVDMTKDEYDLLTAKTYSPENKESFVAARFAFEKRLQELGSIADKPTEYYAVRQSVSDRYDICTIGKGNIVVPIKREMATIAEAKKALLELYKERQAVARVELVHPQTLIERAAELRQDNPAPKHEPNFEIYQLRVTDENADLSFRSMDDLIKQGKKPKFSSYEKVYEGHTTDLRIHEGSVAETLEGLYCKFNIDHPHDFKGHSLSVSDVVVLMDSAGYKALGNFLPPEREKNKFLADLTGMVAALSDKSDMELTESVAEIHKKAAKLGVEPAILREALYMSDDQRVAAAVEKYEAGGRKESELPKQEKPTNNKKLKL